MNAQERETQINYDHYSGEVTVFTTQKHVFDHFRERLGKDNPAVCYLADAKSESYRIICNKDTMRQPYYCSPVVRSK